MIRTLVFIPSFNDHEHLDEMIEYVSNLGPNHMILVIDDGSDVPIKINSKSSRVYIVRVPFNAGLGLALNIALDFAKFKQVDVLVRIDSEKLKASEIKAKLKNISGILIPGGFGKRGTSGKIESIRYARVNKVPFLIQMMLILLRHLLILIDVQLPRLLSVTVPLNL